MGCCEAKNNSQSVDFIDLIKGVIESSSLSSLKLILGTPLVKSNYDQHLRKLEEPRILIKSLRLNALSYSLYLGRTSIFLELQTFGCSLLTASTLIESQNLSIIELLCTKGYAELLNICLPYHKTDHKRRISEKTFTLDLQQDNEFKAKPKVFLTPIQVAVQLGHIPVVQTIQDFYKDLPATPDDFDLDYQEETSGENAPLIACRSGNYPMVRYLHQKCAGNFCLINKGGENAIQVAVAASRVRPGLPYAQIVVYLVDVVGVDFRYNYEETLLLAESEDIVRFIEKKLKEVGIEISKAEVEIKNAISQTWNKSARCSDKAENFDFASMYCLELAERNESLSIIGSESRKKSSFMGSSLDLRL